MNNGKMFVFIVSIVISALLVGYFLGKNSTISSDGQIGSKIIQNKNLEKNLSGGTNEFNSKILSELIGVPDLDSNVSIDISVLNSSKKESLAQLLKTVPLNKRSEYIKYIPKLNFYTKEGKFIFFDPSIPFEASKIDKDDDRIRWFNTYSLPRIKGRKFITDDYLRDKTEIVDHFYASNWTQLESNTDQFAKILLAFNKNGFCDITKNNCEFYNNPQKLRAMIYETMLDFKDVYKISSNEYAIQDQIDLYLTCILPKYTTSINDMLPFLNQIGPFQSLLGVSDTKIVNSFFDSLNDILIK